MINDGPSRITWLGLAVQSLANKEVARRTNDMEYSNRPKNIIKYVRENTAKTIDPMVSWQIDFEQNQFGKYRTDRCESKDRDGKKRNLD